MICCFFGHRDTPKEIYKPLVSVLTDLIENKNADTFYVGHHGEFDKMVYYALKELKEKYPRIKYNVVLSYILKNPPYFDYSDSIYPEEVKKTMPRFSILKRNEWMVNNSDIVVSYNIRNFGGAAKFVAYAKNKNKEVINLADLI